MKYLTKNSMDVESKLGVESGYIGSNKISQKKYSTAVWAPLKFAFTMHKSGWVGLNSLGF